MLLQDHFHPPLASVRHWHSFHHAWAVYLSAHLNQTLPRGYFAEPKVQFGMEVDVAALEEPARSEVGPEPTGWIPPPPELVTPCALTSERVEITVFREEGGPTLAAAVELVSPGNKDRPAARQAFVSKCAAYLQAGAGLAVVDVVTSRAGSLHQELLTRLATPSVSELDRDLVATSYRPVLVGGDPHLEVWQRDLAVGKELPILPLWLPGGVAVPLDLAATYERTCREQGLSRAA